MQKQSVYLFRHGETEWSKSGKHTSITDLPLTKEGEQQVSLLAEKFHDKKFSYVYCSPLLRAQMTCKIIGLEEIAELDDDLIEWRYGDYEGITTDEIRKTVPLWSVFTHSCPNGETIEEVAKRASRMIQKVRSKNGDVAIVSSGHFLRVFASLWLDLPPENGKNLILHAGSYSILTYEREFPVINTWNVSS